MTMIYTQVRQLRSHVEEEFEALCQKHNLTIDELHMLMALYQQGCMTPSKLAIAVGWAATAFTAVLDRLEKKGLIERLKHPEDRRSLLINLTGQGEALRESLVAGFLIVERDLRESIVQFLPAEVLQ